MAAVAESFEARKAAALDGLAALKAERARAFIEGEAFDSGRIVAAEQTLAGLAEAEAEAGRRERVQQWAAAEERKQSIVAAIAAREEQRLANVGRSAKAARDFAEAVRDVLADATAVEALLASLDETAGDLNTGLSSMTLQRRLAALFAHAMRDALGGASFFGHINISRQSGEPEGAQDWTEAERAAFAGYLDWVRRATTPRREAA